ncbi:folate-binding protein YgfZ [soil metagenome]
MPVTRLPTRACIRVAGPDARTLLHGLLTQDVETLAAGELRYGALLTPQGRLVCDLFLLGEEDGVLLDLDAGVRDAVAAKLKMHRLRAKCEIATVDMTVSAAWGDAPPGEGWIADPRLPAAGWRAYRPDSPDSSDSESYEAHRFALGLPDAVRDGLVDKAYATEADLDLLNGVDFQKGCFVGQETTSRMKRRGGIRSRVLPLDVQGAAPGDEVLANGTLRAGEVLAARPGRALALVRLDRVSGAILTVSGAGARLDPPPWLPAEALAPKPEETPA